MQKNILKIKNLYKTSITTVTTTFGDIEIECYRLKGNENYRLKIEGNDKGIARQSALEVYQWIAEYLGLTLDTGIESAKVVPTETKTKRSQSKWRN